METQNKLDELRSKIDKCDNKILNLLDDRFKIALKIGKLKKDKNLLIEHKDRENEILKRLANNSDNIDLRHIENIFKKIFKVSKDIQAKQK